MFQSTIRPSRQAAQVAAIRIAEYVKSDNASTDSETDNTPIVEDGLTRARRLGYDETVFVSRYLIKQCENADFEDQRVEIVEKLFNVLSNNPSVLIYEPKFRNAVQSKLEEFEEYVNTRSESFKKARYREAIDMLKLSTRVNIRNSKMRDSINKHLAEINTILNGYDHWARGYSLKLQFKKMNNILNTIKEHPDYVLC
jgi:hypothetical protein